MGNILQDSIERIVHAATICNAPAWLVEEFSSPKNVIPMKIRVITSKGKEIFQAVRVHQTNPYPIGTPHPYKGGWRYMHYDTNEEMIMVTRALANDMTLKNAFCGLPFGGAKGCVNIDTSNYSTDDLESITKELVIEMLCRNILRWDIDVPGPDYGTSAETMKWMYIQYGRLNQILHHPNPAAIVTGKPIEFDGCPGREDATARGGLIIYDELVKIKKETRVAVQGFGNVGFNLCKLLNDENFWVSGKLVAVCDITNGVYNPQGLPFNELAHYYQEHKSFVDCPLGDIISPEEIVAADTYDLFVTAAKEGLIHKDNAGLLRASTLLELGNSAITAEADEILEDNGIFVIPDIAANPGGVIVSSLEWRKNLGDVYHAVDLFALENKVYEELSQIFKLCVHEMNIVKDKLHVNLRMAAHIVALKRLEFLLKRKHGYK